LVFLMKLTESKLTTPSLSNTTSFILGSQF